MRGIRSFGASASAAALGLVLGLLAARADAATVRSDHPRIFFTSEVIAQVKAEVTPGPGYVAEVATRYSQLKARASWDQVGNPSWNVQDHAAMIALVYLVENKPAAYLTKLKAGLNNLATFSIPAADDYWECGFRVQALCICYDACYNELTDAERTTYAAAIVTQTDHIFTTYTYQFSDYSNQLYIRHGPTVYAALALANDGYQSAKATTYLNWAQSYLDRCANVWAQVGGQDGGWPEGRSYHSLFVGEWVHQLYAWKLATDVDPFPQASGLQGDAQWMIQTNHPMDFQACAVADINTSPDAQRSVDLMETCYYLPILAREYQDGVAQYWGKLGFNGYEFYYWAFIIGYDPTVTPIAPQDMPTAQVFENLGWAAMRSDWTSDATFALFVCGRYFTGHQHDDQNAFTIHKQGTLAIDGGEYGARATECHNSIRIGGNQRDFGGNPWDRYQVISPGHSGYTGHLVAYEHNQYYTYVCGDASPAYTSSKVSLFYRQFVYLHPDLFVIYDRTVAVGTQQREWMLHSLAPATISGNEVTITNSNGTLWTKMLSPAVNVSQYQMVANQSPSTGYAQQSTRNDNYIKFTPTSNPTTQDFVTVLYASAAGTPAITSCDLINVSGWPGASVVISSTTYEVTFSPSGPPQGHVHISGPGVSFDRNLAQSIIRGVQVPPEISRTPVSLSPSCVVGTDAADDSFQVWNSGGGGVLDYTLSDDGGGWLSVSPGSGTSTGAGDTQSHTVTYSTSGLSLGTYNATITITDANASNSPLTIPVTLNVLQPPTIAVSPATLSPSCVEGKAPANDTFDVWNSQGGTLTYTVSAGVAWISSLSPAGGSSTGTHVTHTIVYDTTGLTVRTYETDVTVSDPGATNAPVSVHVALTVRVNVAPPAPSGPVPADEVGDQALDVDPGWSASVDPDGDPVTYDVYFGKDTLPGTPVSVGQSATSYDPGTLLPHSTYHWQVVARDDLGASSTGPEWTFSTLNRAPTAPTNPSPLHQAPDQHIDVPLAWSASTDPDGDTVTYDLYLGIGSLPGVPTASDLGSPAYGPGILSASSTYYWQVVAKDAYGGATAGPEWSFTTGEGEEGTPPGIHITYPTAAESPLATSLVTVTGTANDTSTIAAIWVNGIRATDMGTNYSTWEATIPLAEGWTDQDPNVANTIVAAAVDEWGNYDPSADSVTVESIGGSGKVRPVGGNTQCRDALISGDVDSFQFESLAGALLTLSAKRYGRAEVGFGVELRDPWGVLLVVPPEFLSETATSVSVKNWPLPATGLYTVRLEHASGDGMYNLSLRLKLPKSTQSVTGYLTSGGQRDFYPLTALRGSLLSAQVKRQGSGNELELGLSVLDPCRCALPLGSFFRVGTGLATVKGYALPNTGAPYQTGTYRVLVNSRNGKPGTYRFTASATPPKLAAVKLERALLLGTSPKAPTPGALLTLKVAGADATLANNVVLVDGEPVAVTGGTLRSGRGSLTITLPADTPAGTSAVSFRADGEESNHLTFPVTP